MRAPLAVPQTGDDLMEMVLAYCTILFLIIVVLKMN